MAIDIDNVYQQVLAISNKDKRGYITPQEFNIFARKAQLDIFETTFHNFRTANENPRSAMIGDTIDMLEEKLSLFRVVGTDVGADGVWNNGTDKIHWLENVYIPQKTIKVSVTVKKAWVGADNHDGSFLKLTYYNDGKGSLAKGFYGYTYYFNDQGTDVPNGLVNNTVPASHIRLAQSAGGTAASLAAEIGRAVNDFSPYHTAYVAPDSNKISFTYKQPYDFETNTTASTQMIGGGVGDVTTLFSDPVIVTATTYDPVYYEKVNRSDFQSITMGAKTRPRATMPVYCRVNATTLEFNPKSTVGAKADYIRKPDDPNWTYVVINGKALFNSSDTSKQDFQLHASEEGTLVNKILELAGVSIGDPNLSEVALRNEAIKEAKENK